MPSAFHNTSAESSLHIDNSYRTEGFRPFGYHQLVWPACRSALLGCGLCACCSFLDPQVRVGCQEETKVARTVTGGTRHFPHQRCYLSLNTPKTRHRISLPKYIIYSFSVRLSHRSGQQTLFLLPWFVSKLVLVCHFPLLFWDQTQCSFRQ